MNKGLTISQAARFAGVTTKTVRHYHRLGLVAEPPRDDSDYRRYDSDDLLRLVQVRTLAEAGVPLAEIADLLTADSASFAARVAEVQAELTARIEALQQRLSTLLRLSHGHRLLLPQRACEALDRWTALGFPPDYVAAQAEGLILFRALFPEDLDDFLTHIEERLSDPEVVDIEKRSWEAASWKADDPRLAPLARTMTDRLLRHLPTQMPEGMQSRADSAERYRLVSDHQSEERPGLAKFNELIEENLRRAGIPVPERRPERKPRKDDWAD